jgi:hypothetical protein
VTKNGSLTQRRRGAENGNDKDLNGVGTTTKPSAFVLAVLCASAALRETAVSQSGVISVYTSLEALNQEKQ